MREIVFTQAAEVSSQQIYEALDTRTNGAGDRFIEALDRSLNVLASFPEMGPVYSKRLRRLLTYNRRVGIFYVVEHRGIIIQFLWDMKDNPYLLARRIREIVHDLGGE